MTVCGLHYLTLCKSVFDWIFLACFLKRFSQPRMYALVSDIVRTGIVGLRELADMILPSTVILSQQKPRALRLIYRLAADDGIFHNGQFFLFFELSWKPTTTVTQFFKFSNLFVQTFLLRNSSCSFRSIHNKYRKNVWKWPRPFNIRSFREDLLWCKHIDTSSIMPFCSDCRQFADMWKLFLLSSLDVFENVDAIAFNYTRGFTYIPDFFIQCRTIIDFHIIHRVMYW